MKNRSNIKGKVIAMAGISLFLITSLFLVVYIGQKKNIKENQNISQSRETVVALNEIEMLYENGETKEAKAKQEELSAGLTATEDAVKDSNFSVIWMFYIISFVCVVAVYVFIYIVMLRPFSKLEIYVGELSKGNLDEELKYERVNMFGEFTWAFDHMRKEIKRARQCEQAAIENNKTVIATLSHDIKTPIASIRAYSEALEENMDSTPDRRQRYLDVIMRKCDEVTKLTNDIFIHSLHDLDKLVIKKEDVNIHTIIIDTVNAMQGNKADVVIKDIKECTLPGCDGERIAQVLENLINNARKYAPGEICLNTDFEENFYTISIKDTGKGIPDEDMPFIFDKFYRGKSHNNQPGSGLGLFIVKYVMEQMGGRVTISNHKDGMEVKLYLKKENP